MGLVLIGVSRQFGDVFGNALYDPQKRQQLVSLKRRAVGQGETPTAVPVYQNRQQVAQRTFTTATTSSTRAFSSPSTTTTSVPVTTSATFGALTTSPIFASFPGTSSFSSTTTSNVRVPMFTFQQ